MYSGFSKGDGGVVGCMDEGDEGGDLAEVCASSSAEEALMCDGVDADGEPTKLMLSARLDPSTGDVMWIQEEDKEAVLGRIVGMSQMTSMLHDTNRNNVYEQALALALSHFSTSQGRPAQVLDIGTGTGLLAMFAARHGAECVVGCEMFAEMASIATSVVASNDLSDTIQIVPLKSTAIDSLSPMSPDILVSELLDSALLGEACMYAHGDAIARFMSDEVPRVLPLSDRVLPHSAEVYATLINCATVQQMHDIRGVGMKGINPFRDEDSVNCPGGWSLVPVHWNEMKSTQQLSKATKIMNVSFVLPKVDGMEEIGDDGDEVAAAYQFGEGCDETDVLVTQSGNVDGILCWWNTYLLSPALDPSRTFVISTEPGARSWQDHWLQVVFPLPHSLLCDVGDVIRITCAHDAVHFWLKAKKVQATAFINDDDEASYKRTKTESTNHRADLLNVSPVPAIRRLDPAQCSCGWHLLCGPERLLCLNDSRRKELWECALSTLIGLLHDNTKPISASTTISTCTSVVVDIGDGSMLSLAAAKELQERASPIKVVSIEKKQMSYILHNQLVQANNLEDTMLIWDGEEWDEVCEYFSPDEGDIDNDESIPHETKLQAIICEPFWYQLHALPTWQAMSFAYKCQSLTTTHALSIDDNVWILPRRAWIMAAAFELTDLTGSFGAVGNVSGFDHSPLDDRQTNWHTHMFPFKLSSYRKRLLTTPQAIAMLDYTSMTPLESLPSTSFTLPFISDGRCDCVVLWSDFDCTPGLLGGTSPTMNDEMESHLILRQWNQQIDSDVDFDFPSHLKTSIKFFSKPVDVMKEVACVIATIDFQAGDSDFTYNFSIN